MYLIEKADLLIKLSTLINHRMESRAKENLAIATMLTTSELSDDDITRGLASFSINSEEINDLQVNDYYINSILDSTLAQLSDKEISEFYGASMEVHDE